MCEILENKLIDFKLPLVLIYLLNVSITAYIVQLFFTYTWYFSLLIISTNRNILSFEFPNLPCQGLATWSKNEITASLMIWSKFSLKRCYEFVIRRIWKRLVVIICQRLHRWNDSEICFPCFVVDTEMWI